MIPKYETGRRMEAPNGRRFGHKARWGSGPLKRLLLIVIVALVGAMVLPARLVQATAIWQTAPLPAPRYDLAATTGPAGFVGGVYGYATSTGLPHGSYSLVYQAGNDPTTHSVSFSF